MYPSLWEEEEDMESNYDDPMHNESILGYKWQWQWEEEKNERPKISLSKIDYQVGCQTMDFCVNNDI